MLQFKRLNGARNLMEIGAPKDFPNHTQSIPWMISDRTFEMCIASGKVSFCLFGKKAGHIFGRHDGPETASFLNPTRALILQFPVDSPLSYLTTPDIGGIWRPLDFEGFPKVLFLF